MRRLGCLFLSVLAVSLGLSPVLDTAPAYAADPGHTITVDGGNGAQMFPAYADDVPRNGITTTADTGGSVTLTATTSDPDGSVLVNGRRRSGPVTLDGLAPGDEISVIFVDAGGREPHSLIYLPTQFPALEVTTPNPGGRSGVIGLTLSKWDGTSPNFETIVDRHGVPIHVYETTTNGLDLKRQPDGELSVSRPSGPGQPYRTVMLDDAFQPTGETYSTVGLTSTDGHDSAVYPDGSSLVISYEPNTGTGKTDSVIQRVDPAGNLDWQWDSSDHVAETVRPSSDPDYAHINSVQQVGDDDVIASFRHLSSVYRIATKTHDGYQPGDVIWELGGRDSTFDFVGDPDGGPCAQHTAYETTANHILLFDNRTDGMCVDQADPTGATTNVGTTRIAEYALDVQAGTATLVWSYQPSNYNAFFAGSAERLSNGNTLVGWAAATQAMATEIDAGGSQVWNLWQPQASSDTKKYFTYRAARFDLDDIQDPEVTMTTPAQGATYAQGASVTADYSCSDRGGSQLVDCGGSRGPGSPVDTTSPGQHTFVVLAHDGSGNQTRVERHYTVTGSTPPARFQPDVQSRATASGAWHGANVYAGKQTSPRRIPHRRQSVTTWLAVQNDGNRNDTFLLRATASNRFFRVKYLIGSVVVTRAATQGTLSRTLAPGRSAVVKTVITRTARAGASRSRVFALTATSRANRRIDHASITASAR